MPLSIPFRRAVMDAAWPLFLLTIFSSLAFSQQTRNVEVGSNFFKDSVSNTGTSTIKAGDTIHWAWTSGVHSTTSGACPGGSCSPNGLWDSGVGAGSTFNRTFNNVGTFPYYCSVHGAMMSGTVIVEAAAPATTTTVVTTSGSPSVAGASVTFTATVSSGGGTPTGDVTFKDGGVDLGAPVVLNGQGVATLSTSALAAGTHSITANYAGNASFAASVSSAISQAVRITTTMGLESSQSTSIAGQAVTFTATVTNSGAVATGNISFRDNGIEIGTGSLNGSGGATFQTSTLTAGSHPITAVYPGDDLHSGSTSSVVNQLVNSSPPSPVSFQPSSLNFGGVVVLRASAPLTVTLANNTSGSISLSSLQISGDYSQTNDCGESLGAGTNCMITVTLTPLGLGKRTGQLFAAGSNTVDLTGTGVEFALSLTRPKRPARNP